MPYVREERLSVKQIKQILKSKNIDYSNVVEKRDLILLVEENVPTLTEAKEILNKKTSTSIPKSKNSTSSNVNTKKAYEQMSRMTPAQMKQQATMMRRNPSLVRRSNPQLATKSDAEIRQMADQLDMMAKNPEMFKRMQETMKNMTPEQMKAAQEMMNNMTPEQRAQAQQQFRNSTSGTKTNSNNKLDLSNLGANMSDSQIEMMLNMLKTNRKGCIAMLRSQPALAKSLKGVSDEMLNKNLDMFANMDVTTVKRMIKVASTFQSVHRATGGYTLHICIAILALMFYLIWVYFFASSSADVVDFVSGESEDTTTSSVLIEELDETDEFDYDPFADE